jgi:D-aspartate ligase
MIHAPKEHSMPAAVVLCLSPTGLSVSRSLAPRGVAVYGVDSLRWEIGHFSRWVHHDSRMSYLPAGPELVDAMVRFARQQPEKPVIFNAGDPYIDFVADHREILQHHFLLADSMCREVNSVFLNKRTFYEKCLSLGVDLPATFFPATEQDARAAAKEIRYPAIVKPVHGHLTRTLLRGKKLVEVHDAAELVSWWSTLKQWGTDSVLQEVIEGPESNIVVAGVYMDRENQCQSLFTARKVRQYPPIYGSGSYMEAEWLPDIADLSVSTLQALKYHGVCGTEFKWDLCDHKWKLIEINCRPTLWFALTRAAGVDVVWDAYCDLIGRPNDKHVGNQKNGVRWQLLARDLVSSLHFLKKGELGIRDLVRTTLDPRNKVEGVLTMSDWKANAGYFANAVMQYYSHFIKRDRKAVHPADAKEGSFPSVRPQPITDPAEPI